MSHLNKLSRQEQVLMGTYEATINNSFLCPIIMSILEVFMLIYSIGNKELYGVYLWRYRCFYIALLSAAVIFIAINLYVRGDIGNRFKILNISNPVFAAFTFGWSLAVTYSDAVVTGVVDQTLFMTFSLMVPLSIFLLPYLYAVIVSIADILLLSITVYYTQITMGLINLIVFFIFQLFLGISFFKLRIKLSERLVEEQENANFDSMTGLMNRRSYLQWMEALGETQLSKDLTYISIDINGLKEINDSMGHHAGDILIKGAGQCISQCFADIGSVYRIGGDEFAVILTAEKTYVDAKLSDLESAMKKWSDDNNILLEASYGAARHEEAKDSGITDLAKLADRKMYAAKEQFYLTTGKDRRITATQFSF